MRGCPAVSYTHSVPKPPRPAVIVTRPRDRSVGLAILMVIAAWMVAAILAVDRAYGWLDPRVRGAAAGGH